MFGLSLKGNFELGFLGSVGNPESLWNAVVHFQLCTGQLMPHQQNDYLVIVNLEIKYGTRKVFEHLVGKKLHVMVNLNYRLDWLQRYLGDQRSNFGCIWGGHREVTLGSMSGP